MDFLSSSKAVPIVGVVSFVDEKTTIKLLSAMQLTHHTQGEERRRKYVAAFVEEKQGSVGASLPKEIEQVFKEFEDVMLPELPKLLPPRSVKRPLMT